MKMRIKYQQSLLAIVFAVLLAIAVVQDDMLIVVSCAVGLVAAVMVLRAYKKHELDQ